MTCVTTVNPGNYCLTDRSSEEKGSLGTLDEEQDASEALPPTNWRLYNQHRSRSVPVYAIKR